MENKQFTHLHVHSDHSLLDGYGTIQEYVNGCIENNMKALALTDHNTMTGVYDFVKLCKKSNIKPIVGVEMNLAPVNPLGAKTKELIKYDPMKQFVLQKGSHLHLTLLAKNKIGLINLFKMTHLSYSPENFLTHPRIDLEILKEHSDGIIVLSGCPHSEINVRLRLGQDDLAYEYASILKEHFGDDFYIEIMDYKTVVGYNQEKLIKLANDLDIKVVVTNDVHYLKPSDAIMQEKHIALGNNNKLSETPTYKGGLRMALGGNNRYLKNYDEMKKIYSGEYEQYLLNTQEIVDKVETIDLEYDPHLRPNFDLPEGFNNHIDYLKHLLQDGFRRKRGNATPEVKAESKKRVKRELEIIIANDFVVYFLVVWDFLKHSREQGWGQSPGRGSVGGSELAYLLDISNTDPIRFDLLFERFISEGRGATYQIEYEDGSIETINIANKKKLSDGTEKYIYQLNVGDEIEED